MIDPALLAILCCPVTRMPFRYDEDSDRLISDAAGLAFPIRRGVPILLVDAAQPIGGTDIS